jgi:hypothetical protein
MHCGCSNQAQKVAAEISHLCSLVYSHMVGGSSSWFSGARLQLLLSLPLRLQLLQRAAPEPPLTHLMPCAAVATVAAVLMAVVLMMLVAAAAARMQSQPMPHMTPCALHRTCFLTWLPAQLLAAPPLHLLLLLL